MCNFVYIILRIGAAFAFPQSTDSLFHVPNYVLLSSPVLLIITSIVFSTIITIIAYLVYYCLDQEKWSYFILALILGGVIFTLILEVVRMGYRKANLKFLD